MFRFRTLSGCVAVACLMSSAAAGKIRNPEYEKWASFKVGAFARIEAVTVSSGKQSKQTTVTKLLELTPEKAVVETTAVIEYEGQKMPIPTETRSIASEIDPPPAVTNTHPPAQTKEGEDTVTIAGTSLKCTVTETVVEHAGVKGIAKTWTCPKVPGHIVKTEAKAVGTVDSTSTTTLIEFSTGG